MLGHCCRGDSPVSLERYLPFPYPRLGSPTSVCAACFPTTWHIELVQNLNIIGCTKQQKRVREKQSEDLGGSMAEPVELYVTAGCPYSAAARDDLEWRGVDFVEYDVEQDREAYERMLELTDGNRTVPVIAEEGKPIQVGWMGQGCFV